MNKILRVFLWFYPVVVYISLLGSCSIYHQIPGLMTFTFILTFLVAFLCPKTIYDKRYSEYAKIFSIGIFLYIIINIIVSDSFQVENRFLKIPFGFVFIYIFLKLKDQYKEIVFSRFLTIYTIILLLSIIEFLVIIYFHGGVLLGTVSKTTQENSVFYHYIFNIIKAGGFRFQSLCDEPGDIGTLNGLLIFLIGDIKKYQKQFIVILLGGLLSLSFAFYVLLLIFGVYTLSKLRLKFVLFAIFGGILFYSLMATEINQFIIERYTEELYDNRTGSGLEAHFDSFVNSSDIWFGKGFHAELYLRQSYGGGGGSAGFKKELYETGVIGLFILFITFSYPYIKLRKINYSTMLFFFVFWLSYYQRSNIYEPDISLAFFSAPILLNYNKLKDNYEKDK